MPRFRHDRGQPRRFTAPFAPTSLLAAQRKAVGINVQMLVDERKQVRHLGAIPPDLHEQFLDGVMERVGAGRRRPARGCVRLNMVARLPDASR